MFEKGEYIIYGRSGICKIEDITHLSISGIDQQKLYYVLAPLNTRGSRVYFPVDKKDANARRLISEKEAWALLDEIRDIPEIGITNEKLREDAYRQALNSCDYRQWVSIIKTLYQRKQMRISRGKKMGTTDERYMKLAEDARSRERAFVMATNTADRVAFTADFVPKNENEKAAALP